MTVKCSVLRAEQTVGFSSRTKSLATTVSRTSVPVEQLGIVVGASGPWTMQEFADANSLKRTLLGELSLEF